MNTFTFGRVNKMKVDVGGWQMDGNEVSVSGFTEYGSYTEAVAIRNQLLGYGLGNDEEVVPLVWDERPENSGFYRVLRASANEDPSRAPFGVIDWSLSLYRVHGFGAPVVEATVIGALRANTRGVYAEDWFGTPNAVRSYVEYSPSLGSFYTRDPSFREGENAKNAAIFTGVQKIKQFYVAADKYYDAAATIYVGGIPVVGRRIQNSTDWLISNDIIKMRPDFSLGNFRVVINTWNPTTNAWSPDWALDVQSNQGLSSPADMDAPHTITILRNSPEEVVVRFAATRSDKYPATVDISLKRGAYFFAWRMQSTYSAQLGLQSVSITSNWFGVHGGWARPWYTGVTTKKNVAINPSAQYNGAGYAAMAGVDTGRIATGGTTQPEDDAFYRATTNAAHAYNVFGIRYGTATTSAIAVTAGTTYRVSAYARCSVAKSVTLQIKWYDAANAQVGATVIGTTLALSANTWARANVAAAVAPAGATHAVVELTGVSGNWAAGEILDMDALLVDEGTSTLNTYYDGNTTWVIGGPYYGFTNTASASPSYSITPGGTDGGQFIAGPLEISQSAGVFRPYETGITAVEEWDFCTGFVPQDRSALLDMEIHRYFWASTERVTVVAQ